MPQPRTDHRRSAWLAAAAMVAAMAAAPATQSGPDEELARRQLQNGRQLGAAGKWAEALKDFKAITEVYATTGVADNAWLEDAAREGEAPVLVTSPHIRPFVRGIVERFRAQTSVLSQSEIHPRVRLKTVGSI